MTKQVTDFAPSSPTVLREWLLKRIREEHNYTYRGTLIRLPIDGISPYIRLQHQCFVKQYKCLHIVKTYGYELYGNKFDSIVPDLEHEGRKLIIEAAMVAWLSIDDFTFNKEDFNKSKQEYLSYGLVSKFRIPIIAGAQALHDRYFEEDKFPDLEAQAREDSIQRIMQINGVDRERVEFDINRKPTFLEI
ncbi:hypothetical protein NIES2109_22720 [Nostoc sp. HK-01]|nr:hypothetical protein NIES2109_22720 [Nostoc sp. HK-01]